MAKNPLTDLKTLKVWAPEKKEMILHIISPYEKELRMEKNDEEYFTIQIPNSKDIRYFFKPDGEKDFPDPASQFQPEGVHGPSQIIDHNSFKWTDQKWKNIPIDRLIIYELHVGLFTEEGTFEAIIPKLDHLIELGVNALELMPVCQFPGDRNWGYDGVYPYAVQNSYGGPDGLKTLVNACHEKGVAVILDVVYNHIGPEGNYFSKYGPYFTNKYSTPWGNAINYDGEWSDGVRDYFSDNVIYWFDHFHIDGLRCDAIHAVYDTGAVHFWELVHDKVKKLEEKTNKKFYLIAESDLNSPKVVKDPSNGGYGFDAQWLDDLHHALYVILNPADLERYYDFGKMDQLVKAYRDGFVHSGEWVKFRKRKHGASSAGLDGNRFVVFNQNHDQIGNRADGKRLCQLVDIEHTKLAAAAILLSPYIPMLFMGEEYADDAPFFYFVSHSDPDLIKAVREGRKKEFSAFGFSDSIPDPQNRETFEQCKLRWEEVNKGYHQLIYNWHRELIRMRTTLSPFQNLVKKDIEVHQIGNNGFLMVRNAKEKNQKLLCFFNFSNETVKYKMRENESYVKVLDSKEDHWNEKRCNLNNHPLKLNPDDSLALLPVSIVVYEITDLPSSILAL